MKTAVSIPDDVFHEAERLARRTKRSRSRLFSDALNRSRIATVICVPLTSNLKWASAPGNLRLSARATGLPKDSVANVSQIIAIDKALLTERAAKLSASKLELLLSGISLALAR